MRALWVLASVLLILSAAYALFLLGYKVIFIDSPSEYESMATAISTGMRAKDYPGFVTGLWSGAASPFSLVAGFFVGFFSSSGIGFSYDLAKFYVYGDPTLHFGVGYNIGFIIGLSFIVSVIINVMKQQVSD